MPPKRKGLVPSRAASTPSGDALEHSTEGPSTIGKTDVAAVDSFSDDWTDEQETLLFKAMIRWKPVGMHKHFRMIAIAEHFKSHGCDGYASSQNTQIQIPGIWKKLGSLYNLELLDLREDSFDLSSGVDGEESLEPLCEFKLPDEGYGELQFMRRLKNERSSSPPLFSYQLSSVSRGKGRTERRYSTVDDTDDPRSSPTSAQGTPSGRNTRTSRGTRSSRLAEMSVAETEQASSDQGSEDEEEDGAGDDAMEEDESRKKASASTSRDPGKGPKAATAKASARRSGRKK